MQLLAKYGKGMFWRLQSDIHSQPSLKTISLIRKSVLKRLHLLVNEGVISVGNTLTCIAMIALPNAVKKMVY